MKKRGSKNAVVTTATTAANAPSAGPAPRHLTVARVIAYGLAAAAFAVSFTHVQKVATSHGQHGWVSWAIAISVELMALAGFTETKSRQASGRGVLTAVWPVVMGTLMSLAANVETAGPGAWGVVMAAWPSAAFISVAVMVELEPAGKERMHPQTVDAMAIVRNELETILRAFTARTDNVVQRMDERAHAFDERTRTHDESLLASVRAHGEELLEAVRAHLTSAAQDLAKRTFDLETDMDDRLSQVEEWNSKANTELAKQVREHLEEVTKQGVTVGAQLVQVARVQGNSLSTSLHARVQESGSQLLEYAKTIAQTSHADAVALVNENRQNLAGLGEQIGELTAYVELADMADQVRAERAETERRQLVEHVSDLAGAARARASVRAQNGNTHTAVRAQDGGDRKAVRARSTMRAVTSGASRMPAVRTDAGESDSRITAEEFVHELVKIMRTDPEWTPDYAALEERTGYKIRWLQIRVAEARNQLSAEEEIADAEIVEENAA